MRLDSKGWVGFVLVGALVVTMGTSGCGQDADIGDDDDERISHVLDQGELDWCVESGLDDTPVVVQPELIELYRLKQHHRQVAMTMRTKVQSAMAPLVLATSLFAIEGAADLFLAIAPMHKLDRVGRIFHESRRIRKQKKQTEKLGRFADELSEMSGRRLDELVKFAEALDRRALDALLKIRKDTDSATTTHKLLALHLKGKADAVWIAERLERGAVDKDFVRRFMFDGDLVREYTAHSAHPSWNTLKEIASKNPHVSRETRRSLASKITGLMGEQAAAEIVRSPAFRRRFFPNDGRPLSMARGVGYGGNRSIDIVASGQNNVAFIEVKNWSYTTWHDLSKRDQVVAQLERHNEGIADMLVGKTLSDKPHRLLMVQKEGYQQLRPKVRNDFKEEIQGLGGWEIELIPGDQIPDFSVLIDSVR